MGQGHSRRQYQTRVINNPTQNRKVDLAINAHATPTEADVSHRP